MHSQSEQTQQEVGMRQTDSSVLKPEGLTSGRVGAYSVVSANMLSSWPCLDPSLRQGRSWEGNTDGSEENEE